MVEIKVINEKYDQTDFDNRVLHPIQSWAWGEARKQMGHTVLRFGVFENNNLIEGYTLTFHRVPKTSFMIGYLGMSHMPSALVVDFLASLKKSLPLLFVKIEPYVREQDSHPILPENISTKLVFSRHPLFFKHTEWVDLRKSEEELLASFDKDVRYDIRMAAKKGVEVREVVGEEAFAIFSDLYFTTVRAKKYHGHTLSYHHTIWQAMSKAGIGHIFVAYVHEVPIAAHMIFHFANNLYYPYSGSNPKFRDFHGPSIALYEAMKFGHKVGATHFDLWGSEGEATAGRVGWKGFSDFKKGFGTEHMKLVGSYDLVFSPTLYFIYGLAYRLRRFFLAL